MPHSSFSKVQHLNYYDSLVQASGGEIKGIAKLFQFSYFLFPIGFPIDKLYHSLKHRKET